jgi:diguanylate cyclase (GGDEF)-like protein
MDDAGTNARIKELEKTVRILDKKLQRSEMNRAMLEEILETHSNALKARNTELEQSQALLRESEARYKSLAHHDTLTGLLNRTYFLEHLYYAIAHAKRQETNLAVLFMDLDRFKPINDNFGHSTGDNLLVMIARRLAQCVRQEDIIARFGGDEFAVLLENLAGCTIARQIAQRITLAMTEPFYILNHSFEIGVSLGISLFPDDEEDPEKLIEKADFAMYDNKKNKAAGFSFYHDLP